MRFELAASWVLCVVGTVYFFLMGNSLGTSVHAILLGIVSAMLNGDLRPSPRR